MAKFAHRLTIFILFAVLFLLAAYPVFSGGGREPDLARADELIENRRLDQAILVLTEFARRNPSKFEDAQQRLRRIYRIRDEFNRTADELIATLIVEPENDDKILALSRHLYTLEHEDSPLLINFVARTREIAQFNVNRNHLRGILERGRLLLDRGESFAALQTYAEGMDFMRIEFFAARFGDSIDNEVRRETESVESMLASFQQISSQMGAISAELIRAVNSGELTGIPEITGRLTAAMDRFIAQKQRLYTSLNSFERILDNIRSVNPEMGDRNHLSFLTVLMRGRTVDSFNETEGMLGAFDNYWKNSIGSVISAVTSRVERANAAALASLTAGNYSNVSASLNNTDFFVNLTPLYFGRHQRLFDNAPAGARPQTIALFGNTVLDIDINSYLEITALNEANNFLLQAASLATRQNIDRTALVRWREGSISTTAALNIEQQTRMSINTMQRSIADIAARANQVHVDINRHHNVMHVLNAARAIEGMQTFHLAEEQQSAQRYYTIANQSLINNLGQRRTQFESGRNYLNGESRTDSEGVVTVHRYPAEALAELTAMLTAITDDLQAGNTVLNQFANEQPAVGSMTEISGMRANHQTTVSSLNELRAQGIALADIARSSSTQAEAYRQEGERLFREAQTFFQRQNYDTARDRIQRASDRFNDSLEIQESASLRLMRDTQLVNLGNAIAQAENEAIITEVRNLVNTARNSYFAGNFAQAEDSLTRARNRWRVTNTEENEEVIYWLGIVRTALAATSGRVIPPTAPLYPEMSQLLSQAQRNFDEGVRHINAGQRTLGLTRFDEARQLTREVRLMFPVNQEAGILDLRIEQFMDPAAFNASFEQRLRTAVSGTRVRSMEAFADLLNLAEINPRYPNIRAIVTQAEIDMGFRPPPPNPVSVARSAELTVSASRILDGNQTAQYEVALAQLNEAISLNPANMEAPRVRDRLLSRMSVPGGIVLSSQDEADYQRALRELQAGNNLAAFALVQRLMQNPQNRNITKLVELQRRIQSVL
ncbi:MAG: hypothetical protein FWD40_11170 [Treponema sp.]|nr:hypothetical protein [Treponema sp.]